MAFTYRSVKGSLLTAEEVDANFLDRYRYQHRVARITHIMI